jgi:uncharacterized protein YxeA
MTTNLILAIIIIIGVILACLIWYAEGYSDAMKYVQRRIEELEKNNNEHN